MINEIKRAFDTEEVYPLKRGFLVRNRGTILDNDFHKLSLRFETTIIVNRPFCMDRGDIWNFFRIEREDLDKDGVIQVLACMWLPNIKYFIFFNKKPTISDENLLGFIQAIDYELNKSTVDKLINGSKEVEDDYIEDPPTVEVEFRPINSEGGDR